MGLLGFLKRKEPSADELDVPPIPPALNEGEDLGLTSIGEEIPPPPSLEEEKIPPFPSPLEEEKEGEPIENIVLKEAAERKAKQIILAREKEEAKEELKPLFVRAEKFKDALREINSIKADLKRSEDAIVAIGDIMDNKEREFIKWHGILDDIEKKLMLADKILFKGG